MLEQISNNCIEAWHNQFEVDCKKHRSVNQVIYNFQVDEIFTEFRKIQSDSGQINNVKKNKQKIKDSIMLNLVSSFRDA